jgi:hypothetical protein
MMIGDVGWRTVRLATVEVPSSDRERALLRKRLCRAPNEVAALQEADPAGDAVHLGVQVVPAVGEGPRVGQNVRSLVAPQKVRGVQFVLPLQRGAVGVRELELDRRGLGSRAERGLDVVGRKDANDSVILKIQLLGIGFRVVHGVRRSAASWRARGGV